MQEGKMQEKEDDKNQMQRSKAFPFPTVAENLQNIYKYLYDAAKSSHNNLIIHTKIVSFTAFYSLHTNHKKTDSSLTINNIHQLRITRWWEWGKTVTNKT